MKRSLWERMLSLVLTLSLALGLAPATAFAAERHVYESGGFAVYKFPYSVPTTLENPFGEGNTPVTTFDLSEPIYIIGHESSISGFALWKVTGDEIPTADFEISCYNGKVYSDDAYVLTGYFEHGTGSHDGYYTGEETVGGHSKPCGFKTNVMDIENFWLDSGFQPKYYAGKSSVFDSYTPVLVPPGRYRFVMVYGDDIWYSPQIYTITDNTNLTAGQGVVTSVFKAAESETSTKRLIKDSTYDLVLTGFADESAIGSGTTAASLSVSEIEKVQLMTPGSDYYHFRDAYAVYPSVNAEPAATLTDNGGGTFTVRFLNNFSVNTSYRVRVVTTSGKIYVDNHNTIQSVDQMLSPQITTRTLGKMTAGQTVNYALEAQKVDAGHALTWSIAEPGTLGNKLSIEAATGKLTVTNPDEGTYTFTVKVEESSLDAGTNTNTKEFTLTVEPKPIYYVAFSTCGGQPADGASWAAYTSRRVEEGGTATVPPAPIRPGYIFRGWGTYDQDQPDYVVADGVSAGTAITVSKDVTYYAVWAEKPPIKVEIPAGLNPLTNWALVGYRDANDKYGTTLKTLSYTTPTSPSGILDLAAANFSDSAWTSFNRLELRAPVNGEWVTVASLGNNSAVVLDESKCDQTLTLTKDKDYVYVTGDNVHVVAKDSSSNLTTLTKSKDYYGVTFYNRLKQSLRLPTSLFQGNDPNDPDLTADVWEPWDAQKRYDFTGPVVTMDAGHPENGVTVTVKTLEKVTISGTVYKKNAAGTAWENIDRGYASYPVYASQYVGGRGYYTESPLTPNGDGSYSYSLKLYKDNPVTLQFSYGSVKIVLGDPNNGGTDTNTRVLSAGNLGNGRADCNLCVYDSSVSVSVEAQHTNTQGQADLVDRYLRASRVAIHNDIRVTGTDQAQTDRKYYAYPYPQRISRDSFGAGDSAANATLSVTAYDSLGLLSISKRDNTGAFTYDPDKAEKVTLKDGVGTVTLKSRINSGVVVPLRAEVGGPFLLAWFDDTGKLIGTSPSFYLGRSGGDVASVCPKGDTEGTFTVALMPRSYGFKLGGTQDETRDGMWTTLAQIQAAAGENALLNTWEVTLRSHEVTELTPFTANATQGTNALYVTKPNSTLFANKTSFYDTDDLVTFTGTIGLDDGLEEGKLTKVSINCSNGSVFGNSALPTQLVINGTSYTNTAILHSTYYDFQFTNQPIDLPCTYTLYALPGTANADMNVSVTCDVRWKGGSSNYEPVGSAVVTRPKTTITTLSGSVGSDTVPLQGMAPSYSSELTIYDGDTAIGKVQAVNRKWSGVFPLADIDPNYTTVHLLRAVDDATGSESRTISLYHRKGGPQLTSLRMKWSIYQDKTYHGWYEMDVGGSYTFLPSGMWHTTVTAVVENCQELETLSPVEGSSATETATGLGSYKVLFRVRTDDGEIRLIPGVETVNGTTGTYVGTLPEHLGSFVASVEPILLPKLHNSYDKNGDSEITVHALGRDGPMVSAFMDQMLDAVNNTAAGLKNAVDTAPKESYTVTFDASGNPTVSGREPLNENEVEKWKLVNKSMLPQGQQLASYTHETHATTTLVEWLDQLYDAYTPTDQYLTYSTSRLYASAVDYENERQVLAQNATNALHLDGMGDQMSYHSYVVTDGVKDGEGNVTTPATYKINVDFVTCAGLYLSQASVVLYPGFAGYTDRRMVALGGRTVPMSRILASAGPLDGSMLVALGGHAGNYWYGGHYTANTSALDILANNNFYGSNGINYGKVIMDGLDTGKVFAEFSEYLGGLVDLAGGLGAVMDALSAALDFQRDEKMDQDLITLMSTPCYMKLDARQKALAESYYRDFLWVKGERQKLDVISKIGNFFVYILTSGWFAGLVNGLATGVKAQIFAFLDECAFVATGVETTTSVEAVTAVGSTSMSVFGCIAAIVSGLLAMATASQLHANLAETYNNAFTRISDMCNRKAYEYGDPNCKEPDDEDDEEDAIRRSEYRRKYAQDMRKNAVSVDPSGIVYEGVIENPVEGAIVTLYYGADDSGAIKEKSHEDTGTGLIVKDGVPERTVTQIKPAADIANMTPNAATQITGEDGLYQWFVPQGLWYVTAQKAGYEPGSSNNDKAAKVASVAVGAGTYNLLPVLPAQLEVNIPLRDATAPVVAEARYTTDGVYLTFSKYMMDDNSAASARNSANYTVKVNGVADTGFIVTSTEQGHTPANIKGDDTKTYSRTVLVTPSVTVSEGDLVEVLVKRAVSSYYPTAMRADYLAAGAVAAKPTLGQPVFSGKDSGGTDFNGDMVSAQLNRGDSVSLSLPIGAPADAKIYYTTDGFDPTTASAVYSAPIPVSGTMTVKAMAAAPGYHNSSVSVGSFTVKGTQTVLFTLSGQVTATDGASPDGLTLTLTDADGTVSRTTVVSGGRYTFANLLKDTAYTVSFAGNDRYPASAVTVNLGAADLTQNLTLGRRASSGSSGGSASYGVRTASTAHGSVTVSPQAASRGSRVTVTVKPDQGYGLDTLTVTDRNGKAIPLTEAGGVYTFTMPVGEVTVTATFRESPTADFPDVAPGAWYYEAVQWAVKRGFTTGKPGGVFDPTGEASRAEVVTFLWRCAGAPEPETTTSPFSDVAGNTWYANPVLWAAEQGITLGFEDGTFRPDAIVTREQFVTFLYRMVGSAVNGPNPFTDVETGDWSYGAVLWAAKNAITNGTGGGLFSPEGICDRGQTVTMLHRWFGRE